LSGAPANAGTKFGGGGKGKRGCGEKFYGNRIKTTPYQFATGQANTWTAKRDRAGARGYA